MIRKLSTKEKKGLYNYFESRFGINKNIFKEYEIYEGLKGLVSIGPKDFIYELKILSPGILILRNNKLTTNFFQTFGKYVVKNFIELNREEAINFVKGEDIFIENKDLTDGYVMVKYKNYPLGCSLYKGKKLKNMIPITRRVKLEFI